MLSTYCVADRAQAADGCTVWWTAGFWHAKQEVTQGAVSSQLEIGTHAYMAAIGILFCETAVMLGLSLYFCGRSAKSRWAENRAVAGIGPA